MIQNPITVEELEKLEIPNLERHFENIKIPVKRFQFKLENKEGKTLIEIDKFIPTKHIPLKTPIQIVSEHLKEIIPEIHSSYMMNTLSLKVWQEFIKDFFEEIEEYYTEIIDEPYFMKNELLDRKLISLVHDFYIEYGFYEIEKLVKWKEYGDFEILRRIRNYCREWESFSNKNLPFYMYYFRLEHWDSFFKNHSQFTKKMYDTEKMVSKIIIWKPILFPTRIYSSLGNYYSFFSWKKIVVKKEEEEVELTNHIIQNYFHEDSHFEKDIFWLKNEIPYSIYYDNEKITEIEYNIHKQSYNNQKEGILKCPYHLLGKYHKERLKNFCIDSIVSSKLWSFLDSNSKQPFEEILKKCFHILGRIKKKYGFYSYHDTLSYYLEKNYLILNKLHSCPVSLLFPEYEIQNNDIKKEWKKRWNDVYSFFKEEIICFLFEESFDKSIYLEPIPFFQKKDVSDPKEFIFSLLNKRKSYYPYFSMKDILKIEKEESTIEFIDNSFFICEIDNYIRKCIYNKNGK